MTIARTATERRARRLVRWYPRAWRDRYGEEFCAMLECELDERAVSVRRTVDVAWSGVLARASRAGLAGTLRDESLQVRSSLAWVAGSICAFLAFGLAMWSQLVIGWQWSPPRSHPTTLAIELMSCCVAVLVALGVLAVVPLLVAAVSRVARGSGRRLAVPLCVAGIAVVVLVVGAHVFEDGWPGTGGHPWANQGLVPGGVAAFFWAATLGVTSYWAHPGALSSFPVTEVVWMAVSPVAIVALAAATATVLRRLELSERAVRYELRVGQAASVAMSAFFVGACLWLFDGQLHVRAGQVDLFHAGAIDVAGAVVMALCILCAHQAVFRGLAVARRAPAH